jgi:hypothetical protein
LRQGELSLRIDIEKVFDFYRDNAKLIKALVGLRDPSALRVIELVSIANEDSANEQALVDVCLCIEEFRRCLLQ